MTGLRQNNQTNNLTFSIYELECNKRTEQTSIMETSLLFLLQGKIKITCDDFYTKEMTESSLTLIPVNSNYSVEAVEHSMYMLCNVGNDPNSIKCILFNQQEFVSIQTPYRFVTLPVSELITNFLQIVRGFMDEDLYCETYYNLKREELFILFRVAYSMYELAQLFYPLLNKEMEFESLIMRNYDKIKTVHQLAQLCNCSVSTFKRRFSKHFGQPPHHWILQRKANEVYREIKLSHKTFKEIAFQYGFSSHTDFNRFCKKHFGQTPKEIRNTKDD